MLQRFTLHGRRPDDTERVACSVGGRAFEGRPPALPLPGAHAGAHPGHRVPAGRGPVPAEPTRNLSTSKRWSFTRPSTRRSTHTTGSRTNGLRRRRPMGISSQATRAKPRPGKTWPRVSDVDRRAVPGGPDLGSAGHDRPKPNPEPFGVFRRSGLRCDAGPLKGSATENAVPTENAVLVGTEFRRPTRRLERGCRRHRLLVGRGTDALAACGETDAAFDAR